jgi:hypothetical protein
MAKRMNLRHAAALALVGWYLMTPPNDGRFWHGRLSEWMRKGTFDTQADCKHEISNGCLTLNQNGEIMHSGRLCKARCIAIDDPRLKN